MFGVNSLIAQIYEGIEKKQKNDKAIIAISNLLVLFATTKFSANNIKCETM